MASSTPQLDLDNQLCFALYPRQSRAAIRAYGRLLADLGLTYPQYLTMLVLWEADSSLSVGEIGRRLHLDSGTLTPLLKRLEELGFVARTRDAEDERRVLVSLTGAGGELHHRACDIPEQVFGSYGMDIPAAQSLLRSLTDVAGELERASELRP